MPGMTPAPYRLHLTLYKRIFNKTRRRRCRNDVQSAVTAGRNADPSNRRLASAASVLRKTQALLPADLPLAQLGARRNSGRVRADCSGIPGDLDCDLRGRDLS